MARIKARARDLLFFAGFAVMLFNCSYKKQDCKIGVPYGGATADAEETVPSRDELREMSCACAAGPALADDCAEELWDTRDLADDAGCSAELDALLFCVEDGDACGEGDDPWACDAGEAAFRACIAARPEPERAPRELAARRPGAR